MRRNRRDDCAPLGVAEVELETAATTDTMASVSSTVTATTAAAAPLATPRGPCVTAGLCEMCNIRVAAYRCPRCGAPYCSIGCYRGEGHAACAEDFYRGEMEHALANRTAGPEERRQMLEVLRRAREEEEDDVRSGDFGIGGGVLNSPSATAAAAAEEAAADADVISEGMGTSRTVMQDQDDLSARLSGLDLENEANMDEVWARLTPLERASFRALVQDGTRAVQLLPTWQPWWATDQIYTDPGLVVELGSDCSNANANASSSSSPLADALAAIQVPPLDRLLGGGGRNPAPQLPACLTDICLAYCFTARLLHGETGANPSAACDILHAASSVLAEAQVHHSAAAAFHAVRAQIIGRPDLLPGTVAQILVASDDAASVLAAPQAVDRCLAEALFLASCAHNATSPRKHSKCPLASAFAAIATPLQSAGPDCGHYNYQRLKEQGRRSAAIERKLLFYLSWWRWCGRLGRQAAVCAALTAELRAESARFRTETEAIELTAAQLRAEWSGNRPQQQQQKQQKPLITELS